LQGADEVPDQTKLFIAAGLLLAAALVLFVSPWSARDPDGLTEVARQKGFARTENRHALDDSPLSGYAVEGVESEGISKALAGLIGVLVTFGMTIGLLAAVRAVRDARTRQRESSN
jgi:cobalt/nickel transport protein